MPEPEEELPIPAPIAKASAAIELPLEQLGGLPGALEHLADGFAAGAKAASETIAEHPAMARFCDAVEGICAQNGLSYDEVLPPGVRKKIHELAAKTDKLEDPHVEFTKMLADKFGLTLKAEAGRHARRTRQRAFC